MCEELSWQTRLSQAYELNKDATMSIVFARGTDNLRMVKLERDQTLLLLALDAELDVGLSALLEGLTIYKDETVLNYYVSTENNEVFLHSLYEFMKAWIS